MEVKVYCQKLGIDKLVVVQVVEGKGHCTKCIFSNGLFNIRDREHCEISTVANAVYIANRINLNSIDQQ